MWYVFVCGGVLPTGDAPYGGAPQRGASYRGCSLWGVAPYWGCSLWGCSPQGVLPTRVCSLPGGAPYRVVAPYQGCSLHSTKQLSDTSSVSKHPNSILTLSTQRKHIPQAQRSVLLDCPQHSLPNSDATGIPVLWLTINLGFHDLLLELDHWLEWLTEPRKTFYFPDLLVYYERISFRNSQKEEM